MEGRERKEHYLALKVMRLTRPTLTSPLLVTSDPKDLPMNLLHNDLKNDVTVVEGVETLGAGQFLQLPQSFGNIYLGETFSSYICVHNDSDVTVKDVTLKTEMQTALGCTSVTGPPGAARGEGQIGPSERHAAQLLPDESLDQLIQHEVKEDGNHILTCQVTYTGPDNKRTSFPKYFRFPVSKPLDVKTKFYNAESDEVYVEAQVQNKTSGPICLEKVALESSHLFSVTALNSTASGESVFGRINILPQEASSQFLYCLAPSTAVAADVRLLSGATNVGKLDMVWRSNLGERGRLQTSQLKRMAPECRDVRLSVQEVPNMVALEDPFVFSFRIINTCEQALDLVLGLESAPNAGLAWSGVSGRALGRLESGSSLLINLTLIPLIAGLQIVSGVRLTDLLKKRTYDFDDLAQVFVMQEIA